MRNHCGSLLFGAVLLGLSMQLHGQTTVPTLQPPGLSEYSRMDPDGISVLPSGRYVRPAGKTVRITADPFGLTLSPDGRYLLAVHDRVLTVVEAGTLSDAVRYPSYDGTLPGPFKGGSFMGAAVAPDGAVAYLSGGDDGTVVVFDLKSRIRLEAVSLNQPFADREFVDSFVGDMILDKDGKRLFVLDQFNFRLVVLDVRSKKIAASIPVGRFPFGLAISPDESIAYVANVGIYDYPVAPWLTPQSSNDEGLEFPPFGVPSKEAEVGIVINGRKIPGLGSAQSPEAVSVWAVDLKTGRLLAQTKTGYLMGQRVEGLEIVGGSSPNSIAAGPEFVYVSNATNDNISVLDAKNGKIVSTIRLTVHPDIDRCRGLIPFGLALSPDAKRLYVAQSGLNAVAVIDTDRRTVLGHIPTGWFPTKVCVSSDGARIFVATARGHGAGPNGGKDFKAPIQGTYVGDIMLGTIHAIDVPDEKTLQTYTQQVIDNTFRRVPVVDDGKNPLPPAPGLRKSPIRHIVYITKENRTYDEVFGQVPGGRGDPTLSRFGTRRTVSNRAGTAKVDDVIVMPNHLKIAREFAISDNFYCDSDASVHGHRWMVGTYPNEWVEANAAIRKTEKVFSPAPGRKYVAGSAGAVYPEDYNEAGGLWEHLDRHRIDFFNFGQGFEFSATAEEQQYKHSGIRMKVMFPMPKALFDRTSRMYATYNTSIPDQFRIDMFETEYQQRWATGQTPFPQVVTMIVPNDHSASERPADGYPFRESYMADNDLAVGWLLHKLSRTPYWKNMLIMITEDDAQDGRDSVDAHRSLLIVVSPWVKRAYVSHTHANFGAILKTIYLLMDMPGLNQFDAAASLLQDFFTDKPDYTPYAAVPVDKRIFNPDKALDPYDRDFNWDSLKESPELDNESDFRKSHKEQG